MPSPNVHAEAQPRDILGAGEVPALDGLRAVSVLIVMVSHSGLGWLVPGGFGVTMFFFISGFIITTLLVREQEKRGRIAIADFYRRRALRLYPALAVFMGFIVLAHAIWHILPDKLAILAGFLYFMNYLAIWSPDRVMAQWHHLWSLAVEAHFYLFYPWLFIWLAPSLKRLAVALAFVCVAVLLFRTAASAVIADRALVYEIAYQASEARIDSIAYGALLAVLLLGTAGGEVARRLTSPAAVATGLGVLALTLLYRNAQFRDTLRYSLQGLALMPVVAALVLSPRDKPWSRVLNAPLAVLVGWLSYSLYLWHPAAFALGEHMTGLRGLGFALGWVLCLALASASYFWVERPMLRIRSRFGSERGTPEIAPQISTPCRHGHACDPPPLAVVDGWPIHLANAEDSLAALVQAAEKGEGFSFCPLNLDLLVKLRQDATFAGAMRKARFVIADGAPVAALARRQDPRVERTTGADLVIPLVEACARRDLPVYLLGSTPEVLARVARALEQRCGGKLKIAGMDSPVLGPDASGPVADAAIARIRESGARICFLAFGAPKQEILAARALEQGARTGFVCVGAGLDFIAGAQVRAPGFMRNNGLEWLWRLATNPRRLALRYALCAKLLAEITLVEPSRRWLLGR